LVIWQLDPIRYFVQPQQNYLSNVFPTSSSSVKRQLSAPKMWVSMGVCYSETTHLYKKSRYPYAEVTPLAVMLWKMITDAEIIIRIVYKGTEQHFSGQGRGLIGLFW
jgi:hypothetical protein